MNISDLTNYKVETEEDSKEFCELLLDNRKFLQNYKVLFITIVVYSERYSEII